MTTACWIILVPLFNHKTLSSRPRTFFTCLKISSKYYIKFYRLFWTPSACGIVRQICCTLISNFLYLSFNNGSDAKIWSPHMLIWENAERLSPKCLKKYSYKLNWTMTHSMSNLLHFKGGKVCFTSFLHITWGSCQLMYIRRLKEIRCFSVSTSMTSFMTKSKLTCWGLK